MRNRVILLGILAVGLFGSHTLAFSDTAGIDPRDIALDKTLGGMEEGSRILSPHGDIHAGDQHIQGTPGSHAGSAAETHQPAVSATAPQSYPAAAEANHGVSVHDEGTGANIGTGTETVLPGGNTGTGGGSETSIIEVNADANLETTTDTGGQEAPSGTSGGENSIIEADAGVDLSGGSSTVEADATIDPNASGGLIDAEATTSTDVIEQELTSTAGLEVDVGTDTTTAETTTVATKTGSTNVSATSEVTGGVEADVDGAGAVDDTTCNEADGLSCPTTTTPTL